MRFDNGHLRSTLVAVAVALSACQSSGSGTPATDSAVAPTPAARADSAPPAAGATDVTVKSDSVLLRTDKTQYKAGEKITLTFENKSGASYAFNPCMRTIEHEDGGAWKAMPDEGRMCTMQAYILDARGTRTEATELPGTIAAGRYRVVVRMTAEGAGNAITAVSDPITVS